MKKTNKPSSSSLRLLGAVAIMATGLSAANAVNIFWDTNGTNASAGITPAGVWDGVATNWTTTSPGDLDTFTNAVGAANDGYFSAGTDGINPFTVTLSGTQLANSLTFQEGAPTLTGGVIGLTRATTSSGLVGSLVANTTLSGTATVDSGIELNTTPGTALLKVLVNDGPAATDMLINGPITRTSSANAFNFRAGGAGNLRITSGLSGFGTFEAYFGTPNLNSPVTIAGNQSMGSGSFIFGSSTPHGANASFVLGDGLSDVQSWNAVTVNNATPAVAMVIRSTATMSGTMALNRSKVQVPGSLTVGTMTIGDASNVGTLQLSDGTTGGNVRANAITFGAAVGSRIVGGAAANGTLTLPGSGAVTFGNDTLGGAGTDENNLAIAKTGSGTLNINGAQTYTGLTIVSGGLLNLGGTIASSVTVSNGASLGGEGSTTGSITFAPGTESVAFDPSTGGALTAATINASAATVVVSPATAADGIVFQTPGANGIVGVIGANFIPGTRGGTLSFNATTNELLFTNGAAAPADLTWTGNALDPTFWDVTVTTNWNNGGSADRFYSGDNVLFDDTASSYLVDVKVGSVTPGNVVISNTANAYVLTNASISGSGSVTKHGPGNLTVYGGGHSFTGGMKINGGTVSLVGGANTFSGDITNNGGMLVINNINQIGANTGFTASSNRVVLNGGGLGYTGGTITSETLTFELLGGTSTIHIDSGTTNNFILRTGAAVTGPGNLIKSGTGTLALGQNSAVTLGNTFTGKITVTAGELDIRNPDSMGDSSGITEISDATLYLNPFGQAAGVTFDSEPLVFSGECFIRNFNQGTLNAQVNVLQGTITNNGILSLYSQTNGAYGELQINGAIENGVGTSLHFGRAISNSSPVIATQGQIITVTGAINGPASVSAQGGSGSVYTLANNNYSGDTTVTGGKLALGQATLATNSTVSISNTVLELNFTGATNQIGTLLLNGVAQSAGVYSSNTHPALIGGDGSLLVVSAPTPVATNITFSVVGGNQLVLTWPVGQGWTLQSQTNTLATGLSNNWANVTTTPPYTNTVNPADPAVFFRLKY